MKKYTLIILVVLVVIIAGAVWWSTTHRFVPQEAVTGYVIKNGKVYYDEVMQVQWADNKIHQQIDELEVVGADPTTFTLLKSPFKAGESEIGAYEAKDAHHLYYQNEVRNLVGPAAATIDLPTLSEAAPDVYRDKNAVYIINGNEVVVILSANPATFVVIADPTYGSASTYAKDKNAVYFLEGGYNPDLTATVIPGLDPNTFKVIGNCAYPAEPSGPYGDEYNAIDATHVLAGKDIVQGADPSTFKIVGEIPSTTEELGSVPTVYAVDKNHVYKRCSEIVTGVSPAQCTVNNLKGCEK
jgi:hypothetical protein